MERFVSCQLLAGVFFLAELNHSGKTLCKPLNGKVLAAVVETDESEKLEL